MIITQNKFQKNITINVTNIADYSSVILVYKSIIGLLDELTYAVVVSSTSELELLEDGLYKFYEYSVLTSTIPVDKSVDNLDQLVGGTNYIDSESIIYIYNINKYFIDITQNILDNLLINIDSRKNELLQDLLDIGITTIENLVGLNYLDKANLIIDLLKPFTITI